MVYSLSAWCVDAASVEEGEVYAAVEQLQGEGGVNKALPACHHGSPPLCFTQRPHHGGGNRANLRGVEPGGAARREDDEGV
jgi:hypothetical protein